VTVPAGALVLDFVCSDGGGMWDNNNRNDYHIAIKGAADRVDALKKSRAEELFNDTFERIKVRRRCEHVGNLMFAHFERRVK
jgi:hypothetical protein